MTQTHTKNRICENPKRYSALGRFFGLRAAKNTNGGGGGDLKSPKKFEKLSSLKWLLLYIYITSIPGVADPPKFYAKWNLKKNANI